MARIGLEFATDPYDRDRYSELATIARRMLATLAGTEPEALPELYRPDEGYVTPKVDVRAVVAGPAGPDGEASVLLVRERSDGLWTLPGGWADVGESPGDGVVREVREESGYEVRVSGLVGVYEESRWAPPAPVTIYKVLVRCDLVGGVATHSRETYGVGFFPADRLPALSPRRTPSGLLARAFAHLLDPSLPAEVD